MAPMTRAKSAKAPAKEPDPKQKSKLYINKRDNDSKNTKRYGHCGAYVRSKDTETTSQDIEYGAANYVSAEPVDSNQPVEPRESTGVPSPAVSGWNGRRQRTARRRELLAKDVELEALVEAATTLMQMKDDPN